VRRVHLRRARCGYIVISFQDYRVARHIEPLCISRSAAGKIDRYERPKKYFWGMSRMFQPLRLPHEAQRATRFEEQNR
jgi:hypothetical protein